MKKAFTMIELIFVIVVLGILAAVALPKFLFVSEQAREANLKSFVGTLNRTVGPTIWSKAVNEGYDGNIAQLGSDAELSKYTDIPKEIVSQDVRYCNNASFRVVAKATKDRIGGDYDYYVVCRTGTNGKAPKFELVKSKDDLVLGDFNTSDLYGSTPQIHYKGVTLVTK